MQESDGAMTPEELEEILSDDGRIDPYDLGYEPMELPIPTIHPPGSAAKVRVLRQRASRGEQLWHDQDCGAVIGGHWDLPAVVPAWGEEGGEEEE